jgi:hypothetical protein
LTVDLQNRIWFDEEFANRLAEVVQDSSTSTTTSTTTTTAPAGSVLATDNFQRPNQTFFGTASDGHVCGGDAVTPGESGRARRVRRAEARRRPSPTNVYLPALLLVSALALAACHSQNDARAAAPATPAPRQISAKSDAGASGIGPIVVPTGTRRVALADRALIVKEATRQASASADSVSIRVDIAIDNTGATTIPNEHAFFSLMATEGDILAARPEDATSFDSDIPAHTTRTGTISFEIPTRAASSVRLLYRPNAAGQTVMVPLRVS